MGAVGIVVTVLVLVAPWVTVLTQRSVYALGVPCWAIILWSLLFECTTFRSQRRALLVVNVSNLVAVAFWCVRWLMER